MLKAWKRLGYLAGWCNAVVDDLTTIRPLESATVKPEYIPGKGVLLHVVKSGAGKTDGAFSQYGVGSTVSVVGGPIVWGGSLVDVNWWDHVPDAGGTAYSVSLAAGYSCVWAEANLDTSVVTVEKGDVASYLAGVAIPLIDWPNMIYRFPLSVWYLGDPGPAVKVFSFHDSGMLSIPANYATPR